MYRHVTAASLPEGAGTPYRGSPVLVALPDNVPDGNHIVWMVRAPRQPLRVRHAIVVAKMNFPSTCSQYMYIVSSASGETRRCLRPKVRFFIDQHPPVHPAVRSPCTYPLRNIVTLPLSDV